MLQPGIKTKAVSKIEKKLEALEEDSYRYQVLDTCRKFKTTWIELGQGLYGVHRDKLYGEWGFSSFESYCSQELGIKNTTALKLLKSYHFLEAEEPSYIQKTRERASSEERYPDLESVNLLRLARKNNKIDEDQYQKIRQQVLEDGREPQAVRREVRILSDRGEPKDPGAVRAEKRTQFLQRLVRFLENAKLESMASRFLPAKLIDQMDVLSQKVERELNRD